MPNGQMLIGFDASLSEHVVPVGFPERPERLDAVHAGIVDAGALEHARWIDGVDALDADLLRVHDAAYLDRLRAACANGDAFIDSNDSPICAQSSAVARRAAGMVCDIARRVGSGEARRAFCAVRPPGHHCERDRSMGFCLLNNVAIAAEVLRSDVGLSRVAIIDWDVHHGNGTQHTFESDPNVLYISLHEHARVQYPGTGFADERGTGAGAGTTLNINFMPGTSEAEVLRAFDARVIPAVDAFTPDAVLISAGFDAHRDDPLGHLNLTERAFAHMTDRLIHLANRHSDGRLISILEGGYDLDALRTCVATHVERLLDDGGGQHDSA